MLNIKYITLTIFIVGFLISCNNNPTDANDENNTINTFISKNIKTEGTQYFSFVSNDAETEQPENWDLTLTINSRNAQVVPASCIYFEVNSNPAIIGAPGILLAKTEAASLDDVNEIPQTSEFVQDDTLREAFIGKSWMDEQHNVKKDVYVIKTCSGKYALFQIKHYDFDYSTFKITSIYFDFKYNDDGSTDFSSTVLDSSQSENAYQQRRYFSIKDGALLSAGYGTWDIMFDGSSVWLGPNVNVKKLENTDINDISTISEDGFSGDHLPKIMTEDWYNSDESHHIIPRDFVYFVKTKDNKYVAFEITNYYDDKGESGVYTLKWKYMN